MVSASRGVEVDPREPNSKVLEQLCVRADREGPETWAKVLPYLQQHLSTSPCDPQGWICLARALLSMGKECEALAAAREALRLGPDVILGSGLRLVIARSSAEAGEWSTVEQHCEAALASNPSDPDTLELVARAQFMQDKKDKAEATLGLLARAKPDRSAQIARGFARPSMQSKTAMDQHRWLSKAVSWATTDGPWRELGKVCLALQREEEATSSFRNAFLQCPGDAEVAQTLAQLHLRGGRTSEALDIYRSAMRADNPLHGHVRSLLQKSVEELHGMVKLAPTEAARAYQVLAELQQSLGDHLDALRSWEAAANLDERNAAVWRGFCSSAASVGHDEQLLRALHHLSCLEPQNEEWRHRLHRAQLRGRTGPSRSTPRQRAERASSVCAIRGPGLVPSEPTADTPPCCRGRRETFPSPTSRDTSQGAGFRCNSRSSGSTEQAVEVYSKSAQRWLSGAIVQWNSEMVKIKYLIDGHWCEKVLLRTSEFLRRPETPDAGTQCPSARAEAEVARPSRSCTRASRRRPSTSVGPSARGREASPRGFPVTPERVEKPASASPRRRHSDTDSQEAAELLDEKRLHFKEVLGSGGFGSVFRGMYHGSEVAIKKLHLQDGKITPLQLEEFQKEVVNLQALRHPRLVTFIGAAVIAPTLCIVTEFMPNGSLYALLHKLRTPITRNERASVSLQITEGVHFLHSRTPPFVHRDLKSLNVVMDFDLNAKLCDFGLTQSMEKTHITRHGNEGGSPRYMAPELFDSKGKITEKIDVWALGCLVLEVFTNRVPHEECSTIQQVMIKMVVRRELPFADLSASHTQLWVVVEGCFSFDPRHRVDAAQFLETLSALGASL